MEIVDKDGPGFGPYYRRKDPDFPMTEFEWWEMRHLVLREMDRWRELGRLDYERDYRHLAEKCRLRALAARDGRCVP